METAAPSSPLSSASHIAMMHRPYGPRIHRDESASGGSTAAGGAPGSFSSVQEAARALVARRKDGGDDNHHNQGAGDDTGREDHTPSDDHGAGDHELSDEGNADPEHPAPGENGDDDAGAEHPPVERPRSWAKEDQAEWDELPRSLQEKLAAREEARDKAIRKAQNDAASQAKGLTAKERAAEQARQDYEGKVHHALDILRRENNANYADIRTMADVHAMAAQDPLRFLQWQAHQQELAVISEEASRADERATKARADEWSTFRSREDAAALKHIPDLADPEKAPKIMQRAVAHLQNLGFTADELGRFNAGEKLSLFDHRIQRLIFDGMRYQDVQKAAQAARAKPVPNVQRPGARQPAGTANAERIQTLTTKLNNSGSLKDAAALLIARRSGRSR